MSRPLCVYHGNCADGFAAAWVVREYFNDQVDFHPGVYQEPPPDVTDRDVILVDFSYKRAVLMEMAAKANSILILDHHKSAAEDLAGFPTKVEFPGEKIAAIFDMERSGAGITWDYFFPDKPRPALLNRIEDRDLWRFRYHDTRAVQAFVFSHPYDFELYDRLMAEDADFDLMATEGAAIERKHFKDIDELLGVTTRSMMIGGHRVPVANLPYTLTSDAGHKMAQHAPFAACYWDTPDGRVFSLRSSAGGLDVSEIAKLYGGGGHANAAGFRMALGWEGDAA